MEFVTLAEHQVTLMAAVRDPAYRAWSTTRADAIAQVTGTIATRPGGVIAVHCWLAEEQGTWKIIAYRIEGAGNGGRRGGTIPPGAP